MAAGNASFHGAVSHDMGTALAHLTGVDWFNTLGESVTMVTGLIFVVCVLLFRRGIVGELIAFANRCSGKKADVTAAGHAHPAE